MKYLLAFTGVKKGAIGLRGQFHVEIEADSIHEANLKLYDTHEHVSDLQFMCKFHPNDEASFKKSIAEMTGYCKTVSSCTDNDLNLIAIGRLMDAIHEF